MASHDIILIGASAGGVEAISTIVAGLPRDLRAAVLIVLHVARGRSVFPEILQRAGRLPAAHALDGERLTYGRIYVAPPDHHMAVEEDRVRLNRGPIENNVRPAVDPLFRSAARNFGTRVVGVIATGALDDGAAGLAAVKQAGGIAIVQDPDEAAAPGMPRSALSVVRADHVLPIGEIAPMLVALTREHASTSRTTGPLVQPMEPDSGPEPIVVRESDRPGRLAVLTCPECSGNLWEDEAGGVLRFRCRVGHVYSAESMLSAHTDSVDRALWAALRALEERAALTRKLADRARERDQKFIASTFLERAVIAEDQAALVRQVLLDRADPQPVPETEQEGPGRPEPHHERAQGEE
ncbi:MAG TPA: chemotaxis protein CheB [Vicinamibacterales bacterium]|nr:chemotaxis protein CheB [Vicinamibacterales bacterium]